MPRTSKKVELLAGTRGARESSVAVIACNDFVRMGSGRSLTKLAEQYQAAQSYIPPTRSYEMLKKWSATYGWTSRAEEFDSEDEAQKNAALAEKRREVMEEGFALDYERVRQLKHLGTVLMDQFNEEDADGNRVNLWVKDVKQIGSGDDAERVDIVRFNAALIEQTRGVFDDIAKEVGDRKLRVDSTSIAVNLTAEDMAAAQKKLNDWEKNRFGPLPNVVASGEDDDAGND